MGVKRIGTTHNLVPIGMDNDVIIGILCLVAAQGFPASNAVMGTASRFSRASGLDTSRRYHRNPHGSLMRLSHTIFHIKRGCSAPDTLQQMASWTRFSMTKGWSWVCDAP